MPLGMSIKMRISIVAPDTETKDYFCPPFPKSEILRGFLSFQ